MEQSNTGLLRSIGTAFIAPSTCNGNGAGRPLAVLAIALGMSLLAGCAPGANELANSAKGAGGVAGFWLGLWHGMIVFVTFVISLFSKSVHLYEVHNNGAWYNLGFLLGACMSLGGGTHGAARRPKQSRIQKAAPEQQVHPQPQLG